MNTDNVREQRDFSRSVPSNGPVVAGAPPMRNVLIAASRQDDLCTESFYQPTDVIVSKAYW